MTRVMFFDWKTFKVGLKGLATGFLSGLLFLVGYWIVQLFPVAGLIFMILALPLHLLIWGFLGRRMWGWK